ncbi:MAG TPA: hypothetical protein VHF25_04870, partial [Nitriliruptorales bacterium]|nr:hypothetical protein [Nitriliruptorales bacterium]
MPPTARATGRDNVIDVHLIGYTADLRYLVLDIEPASSTGRYRLALDEDLFLTLDEVRELRGEARPEAAAEAVHDTTAGAALHTSEDDRGASLPEPATAGSAGGRETDAGDDGRDVAEVGAPSRARDSSSAVPADAAMP